jgi:hypothetical protein
MRKEVALVVLVMIAQAACSGAATPSDAGTGVAGSSGGTAAGTGGDGGTGGAGRGGDGGGGRGGGSGGTGPVFEFACGTTICTSDHSLCYAYLPGVPGGGQSRSCMALPAACAGNPTCACVCPPSTSPALGCTFAGSSIGGFCSCSDAAGVTVTCAGQ